MSTLGISDPTILEGVESLYDIYESGFGRVSTLVSIPLFRKRFQLSMRTKLLSMMIIVMTCMLLRITITMKLVIMILVFNWIMPHVIVILLSGKFSMLVDHEKNALGAGYIVEFIHDATENYHEGGTYACMNCNNIKFPLYVRKVLKLCLFYPPMQVDSCSHKLFAHKIPMHRKWVRLKSASHILHNALFMFQFLSFI